MKPFLILILFFFHLLNIFSFENEFTEKLQLSYTKALLDTLSKQDFEEKYYEINSGESIRITDPNLIIFLKLQDIERPLDKDIRLYINDVKIKLDSLDPDQVSRENGYFLHYNPGCLLNISSFLKFGVNSIDIYEEKQYKKKIQNHKSTPYRSWEIIYKSDKLVFQSQSAIKERTLEGFPKSLSNLTQLTDSQGWKKNIRISHNDEYIAYEVINQNISAIEVIRLSGGEPITLLESKKDFSHISSRKFYSTAPCWSGNNRYLYFISSKSGFMEIYRSEMTESDIFLDPLQLTDLKSNISDVTISADDRKLFFIKSDNQGTDLLYIDEPNSRKDKRAFENAIKPVEINRDGVIFSPEISSDNKYLLFCYQKSGIRTVINLMDLNTNTVFDTLKYSASDCLYPAWHPDDLKFSFYCGDYIYSAQIGDSVVSKLVDHFWIPEWVVKPCWDVNRSYIYYISDDMTKGLYRPIRAIDQENNIVFNVINSSGFASSAELQITSDSRKMIITSFQSGNYEIWSLDLE